MKSAVTMLVVYAGVIIALIGGWIANIFKLISMCGDDVEIGALFICRCVGIFVAPFGSIVGFM